MSELRIIIVGVLGRFGSVLARRLHQGGIIVSGIDILLPENTGREGYLCEYYQGSKDCFPVLSAEIKAALSCNDVVLLATPLEITPAAITSYARYMRSKSLLVDLASVKTPAVTSMTNLDRDDIELLSLHPLFPPLADFTGQNVAAIEVRPGILTAQILKIFEAWGCRVSKLTVSEHDSKAAFMQSLCHALILALGQTGNAEERTLGSLGHFTTPFNSSLFELLERISSANHGMYANIQKDNPFNLYFLDRYVSRLQELRALIANGTSTELTTYISASSCFLSQLKNNTL